MYNEKERRRSWRREWRRKRSGWGRKRRRRDVADGRKRREEDKKEEAERGGEERLFFERTRDTRKFNEILPTIAENSKY